MTDKEAFDLIAAHAVPGVPSVETIVALKSDEQASLSPGAYEVLTAAVKKRDIVALLRGLERQGEDNIWRTAEQAREEIETLRTQLAHWKVFGEHAEGERSRLKLMLDRECSDADAILTAIGMTADLYRTDGGSLHMPRILGCLAEPQNAVQAAYGGLTQTAQG